jgi:uncharacterized protein YdeI (YjbR/CyaY-like superfamily)
MRSASRRAAPCAPARFRSQAAFRAWLKAHHRTATELLVRICKTHIAEQGLTYVEALDEALCFGWIDGVRRRIDADSFSIRFTPRKPRSIWSRVNVAHVERLIRSGRMARAGLAAYEGREESRTGIYSFEQRPTTLAPEYARLFQANRKAWTFFRSLAPWYQRTSTFWVMSAKKEETRMRRLGLLIARSAEETPIKELARPTKPRP